MQDKSKKSRKKYAAPEALYNLDGDNSVRTLHERNDSRYAGSPGAPIIDLSDKEVVQVDTEEDDMSVMTNLSLLSNRELIERLKSTQKAVQNTDSASANVNNKTLPPGTGAEDDDSSSYESYSGSSCSESSDENQTTTSAAPSG